MAPRRTAIKEIKTAQAAASTFDFAQMLAKYKKPIITESIIWRADMYPDLEAREAVLADLDERIEKLDSAEGEDGQERDVTEVNPLTELTERRYRLTLEYNALAEEYNASAWSFSFRPPDKKGDADLIKAMMDEVGIAQPEAPDKVDTDDPEADAIANEANQKEFEKEFEIWWEAMALRSMTVTCIKHPGTDEGAPPLTLSQWEDLRDTVGPIKFAALGTAWFAAVNAGVPAVPLSPRPIPTHTTETRQPRSVPRSA
jgi:hypothetical protein